MPTSRAEGLRLLMLDNELSIVHLISNGTLDARLAAFLWIMMEHRASVIVAAGPRLMGKSTLLHAISGFLPSDTKIIYTQGRYEEFQFVGETEPAKSYIMVNELSDHTPLYLWGPKVGRLFDLLDQGYALGATMHADTPDEVILPLSEPPVAVPRSRIAANVQLIILLGAFRQGEAIRRRITAVYGVRPNPLAPHGVGIRSLAAWQPDRDAFTLFTSPEAWGELADWAGATSGSLQTGLAGRAALLADLAARGISDFDAVRQAVLGHTKQ